jgi:ATP-dependent RNA helicase DDX5/DBP2
MALTGRDIVCIAETGSGKTIGFILPALIHIKNQKPLQHGDGPIALVVAPTRELACQIEKEAKNFGGDMGVRMCCVYGGAPRRNQEYALRGGCELVICTPGRMLDFIERKMWRDMRRTTYVVFDEADRMLDMGFEPQIRALLGQIRPDRQMQMWSATWPKAVRRLASDFLPNDKIVMKIGSDDGKACERVTQQTIMTGSYDKMQHLQNALLQYANAKVLIFTGTKRMADDLSHRLRGCGVRCAAIHGDKKQFDRERVLADFKAGRISVMIATDVASRGIHVNDIALVVNYDFPQCLDDYIHRIGRTGRAGTYGNAITFFDMKVDGKKARGYAKILRDAKQEVPRQLENAGGYGGHGGNRRSRYRPY